MKIGLLFPGVIGSIVLGSILALPSPGSATACPPTGTPADYVAFGNSGCTITDKLFNSFTDNFSPPSGTSVTITPVTTPLSPGLTFSFSPVLSVASNQSVSSGLGGVDATVIQGSDLIDDMTLTLNANTTGTGSVSMLWFTGLCGFTGFLSNTSIPPAMSETCTSSGLTPKNFASLISNLGFDSTVSLSGGANGTASLSGFTVAFSEVPAVPEPETLGLIVTGLMSLGLLRRLVL